MANQSPVVGSSHSSLDGCVVLFGILGSVVCALSFPLNTNYFLVWTLLTSALDNQEIHRMMMTRMKMAGIDRGVMSSWSLETDCCWCYSGTSLYVHL